MRKDQSHSSLTTYLDVVRAAIKASAGMDVRYTIRGPNESTDSTSEVMSVSLCIPLSHRYLSSACLALLHNMICAASADDRNVFMTCNRNSEY